MNKKPTQTIPVVKVAALISCSLFTLLSVIAGLPPEVILLRVSIGTMLVIGFGVIFKRLISMMAT